MDWYRNVYLRSEHWRGVRRRKLDQQPPAKCQMCGSREHLDVHHASCERIGREDLRDLVVLCRKCHSLQHASISDSEKIHRERLIMKAAKNREIRDASESKVQRPTRKRRRITVNFVEYAYHCLRMQRSGLATEPERQFLRSNAHDLARMRV